MKIRVSFDMEIPEEPDDRGSVDHWVASELVEGIQDGDALDTDDLFEEFNVEWEEIV